MLKAIRQKVSSGMGRDVVWTFAMQMLIMLCSFAINKLLANRLSIDDFGQYNVIKRSVQVVSFVMLAGVGIALPRYIPLYRNSTPPRPIAPLMGASFIYILGVTLVVLLACMAFSQQMQDLVIGRHDSMPLLVIALAYAFMLAMAQYVFAYYRGIGDFRWYNSTQLALQAAIILPLILLPVLSVSTVFASWLVVTVLLVALFMGRELWLFFRRGGSFASDTPLSTHLATIIKYSSGRLVADFFQFSLAAFPLIYINQQLGLQATAYFSVGIFFVTIITPLFSFMGIILLPYVSQAIARHELQTANRVINRLARIYLAAAAGFILMLYVFTEFLTRLFFTDSYIVTAALTRIMILAILPQSLYMLYRNTIDAVSIVPYNAIILGLCLTAMTVSFHLCSTLPQLAWAYVGISFLQGALSFLIWNILRQRTESEA